LHASVDAAAVAGARARAANFVARLGPVGVLAATSTSDQRNDDVTMVHGFGEPAARATAIIAPPADGDNVLVDEPPGEEPETMSRQGW
jgi:hypothetical protein